jgi:hypothetical protein
MSSAQIVRWLGVLAMPGLVLLLMLIGLRAIPGPRERAWYVRMWVIVAVMIAVSGTLFELLPRNMHFYSQGLLVAAMLTVPWLTRRMSLARKEDSRSD